MNRSILCAAAVLLGSAMLAPGQNPTMLGHPEDYPRVEVAHGARLYSEHCDRCHGARISSQAEALVSISSTVSLACRGRSQPRVQVGMVMFI